MKKAWFSTKELLGVGGLPKSRQGVTGRSRLENWDRRPRAGGRGGGLEYALESLPAEVRQALTQREMKEQPAPEYRVGAVLSSPNADPLASAWMVIYDQLLPEERGNVISLVMREGIEKFMTRLGIVPRR
ncbi:DNA-binding protein [Sodalis sp. dw_96]|uniref:DNA-binding protein n=1 Tax=Sodalis sp. dw_96 TaxID=2719794 RepID=UPI001BD4059C|nr:DNA-binding protein [Sodalis sp. dw_96]